MTKHVHDQCHNQLYYYENYFSQDTTNIDICNTRAYMTHDLTNLIFVLITSVMVIVEVDCNVEFVTCHISSQKSYNIVKL